MVPLDNADAIVGKPQYQMREDEAKAKRTREIEEQKQSLDQVFTDVRDYAQVACEKNGLPPAVEYVRDEAPDEGRRLYGSVYMENPVGGAYTGKDATLVPVTIGGKEFLLPELGLALPPIRGRRDRISVAMLPDGTLHTLRRTDIKGRVEFNISTVSLPDKDGKQYPLFKGADAEREVKCGDYVLCTNASSTTELRSVHDRLASQKAPPLTV
jgi:hypothetical protein